MFYHNRIKLAILISDSSVYLVEVRLSKQWYQNGGSVFRCIVSKGEIELIDILQIHGVPLTDYNVGTRRVILWSYFKVFFPSSKSNILVKERCNAKELKLMFLEYVFICGHIQQTC